MTDLERHARDIAADVEAEMQRRIADAKQIDPDAIAQLYAEHGEPMGPGEDAAARWFALRLVSMGAASALRQASGGAALDEARRILDEGAA